MITSSSMVMDMVLNCIKGMAQVHKKHNTGSPFYRMLAWQQISDVFDAVNNWLMTRYTKNHSKSSKHYQG